MCVNSARIINNAPHHKLLTQLRSQFNCRVSQSVKSARSLGSLGSLKSLRSLMSSNWSERILRHGKPQELL